MDRRDRQSTTDHRQAAAETRPEQAAARERDERLDDLVAGAGRVGERIAPDVDPDPDVAEQLVGGEPADDQQDQADDDVARSGRGHVDEREEHGEEEQRRAQVALDDDDRERDRPHDEHRQEVRQGRQAERPQAGALVGQQRPVLRQVARQEHDQDDLEQLGRLPADRPDAQGQERPVRLLAEHERQQQQADPDRRPGVLVATQPGIGADDDRQDA